MERVETKSFGNLLTTQMKQLSFRTFMGLRFLYFIVAEAVSVPDLKSIES